MNPEELDGSRPPNVTATMLTGLNIDQYFARTGSNGTMSYLTDMLGSTLALTNSSGAITSQYTYDPFSATTVTGSSTNPFQFTGRENDGTGLYYYRARYYSPTLQRFISQDPLGFGGGDANLYGYVYNNPTDLLDPFGLYGTSSCKYYQQACAADGGKYYCYAAPAACWTFPKSKEWKWSRCVRQCLQQLNYAQMPERNACSIKNEESYSRLALNHIYCLTMCTWNSQDPWNPRGPNRPDGNPVLWPTKGSPQKPKGK